MNPVSTPAPSPSSSTGPSQEHANAIGMRLARLRDELMVKNHLAAMDAKDAVHELGHELDRLSAMVAQRARALSAQAADAELEFLTTMFEVDGRLLAMEAALKANLAGAARSATAAAETTRMKSALAAMDAHDAVDARMAEAKRELHRIEERGQKAVHDVDALMTRLGVRISKLL